MLGFNEWVTVGDLELSGIEIREINVVLSGKGATDSLEGSGVLKSCRC
jgi:hypothetical protein